MVLQCSSMRRFTSAASSQPPLPLCAWHQSLLFLSPHRHCFSTELPHPSFRQLHQTYSHLSPSLWILPCFLNVSPHPPRGPTSPTTEEAHYGPLHCTELLFSISPSFYIQIAWTSCLIINSFPSFPRITHTSPASDLATQGKPHSTPSRNPSRLHKWPPSSLYWSFKISPQPLTQSTTPSFYPPWQLQGSAAHP